MWRSAQKDLTTSNISVAWTAWGGGSKLQKKLGRDAVRGTQERDEGACMADEPKKRVVIVDDDGILRELLKGILRQGQFDVAGEAGDGERCLALAETVQPDVICLDIHMPKMNGIQCLEALRASHPQVKVVMISGDATLPVVQEALTKGASGFIVKPFNAARVLDTLQRCLNKPPA
jgi:two-component system chemotaxis response regulator CheY